MIEGTLRVLALLVAGTIGTLDRQLPPAQADPVAPQVQTPADVVVVTASRAGHDDGGH